MAKNKIISFQEAMDELKAILEKIENETVDIDIIPSLIIRAKELQTICESKLIAIKDVVQDK